MLPRLIPLTRSLVAARTPTVLASHCMSDHAPTQTLRELVDYTKTSYDHHPVPQGDWQENYDKKNKQYNMFLGASLVFFIGSLIAVRQSGVLYLHSKPDFKSLNIDPSKPMEE